MTLRIMYLELVSRNSTSMIASRRIVQTDNSKANSNVEIYEICTTTLRKMYLLIVSRNKASMMPPKIAEMTRNSNVEIYYEM